MGGCEQVSAGGGTSEQNPGKGAERGVNLFARARLVPGRLEKLVQLGGHERNKATGGAQPLDRPQEDIGAKVHRLGHGACDDRLGSGQHRAGQNLGARNIVRG